MPSRKRRTSPQSLPRRAVVRASAPRRRPLAQAVSLCLTLGALGAAPASAAITIPP